MVLGLVFVVRLGEVLIALSGLARTGWMLRGVPGGIAESVAEHLFTSALIAYELSVEARRHGFDVDPKRATVMALSHDLAEAIVGDISRRAGIIEAKEAAEARAFEALEVSLDLKELYREYVDGSTLEAVLVRVSDNLATYAKARFYARLGYRVEGIAEDSLGRALELASLKGLDGVVKRFLERLEH
jgi:putative hydrolase of HD superfamily